MRFAECGEHQGVDRAGGSSADMQKPDSDLLQHICKTDQRGTENAAAFHHHIYILIAVAINNIREIFTFNIIF